MQYVDLLKLLLDMRDEKYAAFQKPLSNSNYEIIGITCRKTVKYLKKL